VGGLDADRRFLVEHGHDDVDITVDAMDLTCDDRVVTRGAKPSSASTNAASNRVNRRPSTGVSPRDRIQAPRRGRARLRAA
jgi:hypothetical protein